MAILWCLLGLLGLLLLLLCLPVGVQLSYQDKPDAPQPSPPLLTAPPTQDPALREALAFLEQQGLYPARAPFPPPREKELRVRLRVLGIPFTLYPRKKKSKAKPQPAPAGKTPPQEQKAPAQPKLSKAQLREALAMAHTALQKGRGPLRLALRGIGIRSLQLDARISREDSYQTALWYGRLEGIACSLLALLNSICKPGRAHIRLSPDFTGRPEEVTGRLEILLLPAVLLAAGLWLGGAVVLELVKQRGQNRPKPEDQKNTSQTRTPHPTSETPAAQTERTENQL